MTATIETITDLSLRVRPTKAPPVREWSDTRLYGRLKALTDPEYDQLDVFHAEPLVEAGYARLDDEGFDITDRGIEVLRVLRLADEASQHPDEHTLAVFFEAMSCIGCRTEIAPGEVACSVNRKRAGLFASLCLSCASAELRAAWAVHERAARAVADARAGERA